MDRRALGPFFAGCESSLDDMFGGTKNDGDDVGYGRSDNRSCSAGNFLADGLVALARDQPAAGEPGMPL